ncbi:MAG: LysE family transporter [Nitrospiraceae bacterium]|nr:LysE family transporter [Nitrospiraceae bacterium]
MNRFLFLFIAYVMGFLTAIPIGATQIEIAKRSLNNQLRSAYMVAAGSVCSDVMYGFIAMFGVAPFLENKVVVAYFGLAAAAILWVLAFFTFKDGEKAGTEDAGSPALKSRKLSLVIGFTLAVTNPMMIVWWLIGEKFIRELGLVRNFTADIILLFLAAGGLGLFSYLFALSNILYWTKRFISKEIMRKINYGLGAVLVLLSFYFLISSLRRILHLHI